MVIFLLAQVNVSVGFLFCLIVEVGVVILVVVVVVEGVTVVVVGSSLPEQNISL